ncbi:hypothetical protein ACIBHX_04615 [Nonomuraea sp. NPDC050536]|uniref:hypothetical protein n=1 Tax=Nonomuraea sp. NPDC050536 TaxID=3364366 RepID=UPI0037C68CE3
MIKTRACAAVLAAFFALSACGQPTYTYVKDNGGTTYFKVPSSYTRLDADPLEALLSGNNPESAAAQERKQRVWSTAFDQSTQPQVLHLFGSNDAFVYAAVHKLTDEERDSMSLNQMRDFILPVTAQTRSMYLSQFTGTGRQPLFTNFESLGDKMVQLDKGARGVRTRFNYEIGGQVQTFDQTAILDEKGATVSILLFRCQSQCFQARSAEFEKIIDSFKLLRLPG